MNDLLPILSGLIVISALAVVSSSSEKKETKEVKERKEYKPREKKDDDDDFKKIFGYFKKNLSAKKRPKRYHKIYSKGKTKRDKEGDTIYKFKEASR